MRYAVINAGGAGTRLWPMSRAARPKQLFAAGGATSLLRLAYERLDGLIAPEQIFVCASVAHRELIAAELPELPEDNLLAEPVGRDSAAAIGLACAILAERDADATVAFVTSDHIIEPVATFRAALRVGFGGVEQRPESMVVFGITPVSPHTGLGYIEWSGSSDSPGPHPVAAFTEKPDRPTAERYATSGRHLWNAGMFVWRAGTLLDQLDRWLPPTGSGVRAIARAWGTPAADDIAARVYAGLRPISIDYAVVEPAAREQSVAVVPMDVDWLDIGSWPAFADTLDADDGGNVGRGRWVLVDSSDNIVVSDCPDHLIAAVGLRDTIVVHTDDVTLICPRSAAERVKDLVARVRSDHGDSYL